MHVPNPNPNLHIIDLVDTVMATSPAQPPMLLRVHVVNSSSVNSIKNNLDTFWGNDEVYF